MRIIILVAVLSSAAASYGIPGYAASQQLFPFARELTEDILRETTTLAATPAATNAEISSSSTSGATSPATAALETQTTSKPSTTVPAKDEEQLLPEESNANPPSSAATISLSEHEDDSPKRRVISYDQRQEGQYNIRADLENFMIVLIPPTPSEGLNLLELLTRSSLRRNSHVNKGKKKHYSSTTSLHPSSVKFRNSLKGLGGSQNFNYSPRTSVGAGLSSANHGRLQTPVAIVDNAGHAQRLPEFIEGRTPYHVDISASDDEQSRLHPDRQVDVLPPPYPLAYQQLIKPYHLEAEPTIIQALPPSELTTPQVSNNFFESYNQLFNTGLRNANSNGRNDLNPDLGYYRLSRALRGDNQIDSNNLSNSYGGTRHTQLPLYRSDLSFGASSLYPPIDVPRASGYLTFSSGSGRILEHSDAKNDANAQSLEGNSWSLKDALPQDDVEWRSVGFVNSDAKALLSDGMERCAPGFRRDSYGLCREIEGY